MTVNVAMLYPNADEHDTAITGLSFSQALSDDVVGVFGKFNALDLFYSLYPQTGRGVNGFMNASMVLPLSVTRVAPLSFMGAGVEKMSGKQVQGALLVYDTQDCTTTSGFDNLFGNGANIMAFWRFFTDMGGLPGSHGFGGIWSTGEFLGYDPSGFVIVPGQGIVAVPQDGAYSLFCIYEQSLWMDHCQPTRNIGLQSTGISATRPHDAIGLGYFHTGVSDDLQNLLSPVFTL